MLKNPGGEMERSSVYKRVRGGWWCVFSAGGRCIN